MGLESIRQFSLNLSLNLQIGSIAVHFKHLFMQIYPVESKTAGPISMLCCKRGGRCSQSAYTGSCCKPANNDGRSSDSCFITTGQQILIKAKQRTALKALRYCWMASWGLMCSIVVSIKCLPSAKKKNIHIYIYINIPYKLAFTNLLK